MAGLRFGVGVRRKEQETEVGRWLSALYYVNLINTDSELYAQWELREPA